MSEYTDQQRIDAEAQRIAQERLGTIEPPEQMGAASGFGADLTVGQNAPQRPQHNVDHDERYGEAPQSPPAAPNPPQAPEGIAGAYVPPQPPSAATEASAPLPQNMRAFDEALQAKINADQAALERAQYAQRSPDQAQFKTRQQVKEEANRKRNTGVVFHLEHTGSDAIIRDMSFASYTMLAGLPANLRDVIDEGIRNQKMMQQVRADGSNVQSLSDALELMEKADEMTQAVCIAAFIKPRLVQTEAEAEAESDPLVWCVTDVDERDRQAVLNFIQRNRNASAQSGGAPQAIAGFPG